MYSPDGKLICFQGKQIRNRWILNPPPIFVMNADGTRVLDTGVFGVDAAFTPDGKSIVSVSNGKAQSEFDPHEEVWISALPGGPSRQLTSTGGLKSRPRVVGDKVFFSQHYDKEHPAGGVYEIRVDGSSQPRRVF